METVIYKKHHEMFSSHPTVFKLKSIQKNEYEELNQNSKYLYVPHTQL